MRFLRSLLAGLLVSAVIVAAAAYRLHSAGPSKPQSESATENDAAKLPQAKIPKAILEGTVDIAPLLAGQISKTQMSSLIIATWTEGQNESKLVGYETVGNPSFPVTFRSEIVESFTEDFLRQGKPTLLRVSATFCPNLAPDSCNVIVRPHLTGFTLIRATPPSAPVNTVATPLISLANTSIVIDRKVGHSRIVECVRSGLAISGTIQPTGSMITEPSHPSHFVVVSVPMYRYDLRPPFISADHSPLTSAEMAQAAENGIAFSGFTLAGSKPVAFSIKLPKATALVERNYIAVACKAGEDDTTCAARLFPFPENYAKAYPKIGASRLIPKNLEDPECGVPTVLYFNNWKPDDAAPSIEDFKKAQIPEIVEGMFF